MQPLPALCPAELARFTASLMLLQLDAEVVSDPVYANCGRPKKVKAPISYQFRIKGGGNQTGGHSGDQ